MFGQLLIGLINGAFYAMLSLGLAVIFGLLNIINFAHGAQYMLGAFCAYFLLNKAGVGYWPSLVIAPLAVGLFGMLIERTMLSRLYKLDHLYGLLLTFGLALVPADLVFVTVLQLTLIMEVALVHRVNLKSDRARDEVFEVLGYSNGADTVNLAGRAGPKVLARVAEKVLTKRGLAQFGRVVPILASPVVAYLNNRDLQRAGEAGDERELEKIPVLLPTGPDEERGCRDRGEE